MGIIKVLIVLLIWPICVIGQTDLSKSISSDGIRFYGDTKNPCLFYEEPKPLELVFDRDGITPNFIFTRVRYTGIYNSGNNGDILDFSDLQFEVQIPHYKNEEKIQHKINIQKMSGCDDVELRPILLHDIDLTLGLPIENENVFIDGGYLKNNDNSGIWSNKIFSLSLDRIQTQLLWNLLQEKNPVIDVHYQYLLNNKVFSLDSISNQDRIVIDTIEVIYSNTLQLEIDFDNKKNIKSIDLNQQGLWVNYPLLDILCFDFKQKKPSDLFRRRVRVRAIGFSTTIKEYVYSEVHFERNDSDKVAHELSFPEPVRMDLPFHYQTTDTYLNGEKKVSNWILKKNWTFIDITK